MDSGSRVKGRKEKERFYFTTSRDVDLLKCALQQNPWQQGKGKWADVAAELNGRLGWGSSERTLKDRVSLLLEKFRKQSLTTRTGTEEERTERGALLEEIETIVAEEEATINAEIGPDSADTDGVLLKDKEDGEDVFQKSDKAERMEANAERDRALKEMGAKLETPKPKRRPSVEEELIRQKAAHDMEVEKKRLRLEEENQVRNYQLETARIELEVKREDRMSEEVRRRDEFNNSQLLFNNKLLEFMMNMKKD